jgi:hypothetical protein
MTVKRELQLDLNRFAEQNRHIYDIHRMLDVMVKFQSGQPRTEQFQPYLQDRRIPPTKEQCWQEVQRAATKALPDCTNDPWMFESLWRFYLPEVMPPDAYGRKDEFTGKALKLHRGGHGPRKKSAHEKKPTKKESNRRARRARA